MKLFLNLKAILKFTGLGLTALYCSVNAEPLANTLPQGGTVASGNVTFSNEGSSDAPVLNINQSTQKAILNWNSFDVGSKSTVNFNQPNSSSSTLNRIHSQNASEIHGRINATGEVLLVNENGILFGKDSQIDVGSIAASANNIKDEDFLKDNYVFEESDKESTVANQGNIRAALNGYAALLAPHVINEGIVTAQKGTVAFASGNKITLKINDGYLTALSVSPSKYNALIENKYIVEAPGGQVILSATAVNQIKGGVIKQAGIINVGSTPTMKVSQAGRIVISSNHFIATSESQTLASAENQGGDIKIETTKTASIEDGAIMTASATVNGSGGNITIASAEKLALGGKIEANGANEGSGGKITTRSPETTLSPNLAVFAKAGVNSNVDSQGSFTATATTQHIETNVAKVISDTIEHSNVTLVADGGNIDLDRDVSIMKQSTSTSTLLKLSSAGTTSILGSISNNESTELSVQIASMIDIRLDSTAFIKAAEVSFVAERDITVLGDIYAYGGKNGPPLAKFMGANVALLGAVYAGRSDSNSSTVRINAGKLLSTGAQSRINLLGRDAKLNLTSDHEIVMEGLIQTNAGAGRGGTYIISAVDDISITNATITANGHDGGFVRITSSSADVNTHSTIIQTNGSSGRGGTIEISGFNKTLIQDTTIQSTGATQGGNIYLGNNLNQQTIPFSKYTLIDPASIVDTTSDGQGGFVETSGHILDLLTTINVGRGGIWLIDPYDVTIASSGASGTSYSTSFTPSTTTTLLASSIVSSLNSGTSVSITTGSNSANTLTVNAAIAKTSGGNATLTLTGGTIDINAAISSTSNALNLTLDGGSVDIGASLTLNGGNLSITNSSDSYIQSGAIFSGSGSLTKLGSGTLYISHASNTYTGKSYINGGTVSITGENSLGATPGTVDADSIEINNGATLTHPTTVNITISANRGILLGSGDQTIMKASRKTWDQYGPISGSGNLILDDSTAVSGDGGGGGRFRFFGANTYTGTTTIKYVGIKDPGLWIYHANALQNSTLIYDNTYIPNNGEAWEMLCFCVDNIVLGGLSGDRTGIYSSSNKTISIGNNDADTTYSGDLTLSGLNKIGSGTLTLSGSNSFALELTEGELNVGSANAIGSSGTITYSGGSLQHSASNTTDYSSRFSLSDSDTLKIDTNGQNVIWASDLTASNLLVTKYGTGNLYINGSYSGNTNAVAGSIYISGVLSNSVNNLTLTSNTSYTSLSGYTSVNLGSYTLTLNLSSNETFANVISGTGSIIKTGSATLTLSGTNTYTGDTTINVGSVKLTGSLSSSTDLTIASGATLDLQATQTFASLDLDGTISNTAGTSSLTITGTSDLEGSVTTTSTQTYTGAVTLTGTTTLTTSSAQVTFTSTVNSDTGETNNLTVTASETEFNGIVGGTRTLGVMDINGTLDLNAAITAATSIDVSSTSNLGANVTTTGTQTYNGATTLSAADRNLTASTVNFGDTITGTGSHDLTITGALDLDGALTSVVELTVTSTSNLGANVTTTSTQAYQGAVTLSDDITLTTTNSNVTFSDTVDSDAALTKRDLTLTLGSGSATFSGIVGATTLADMTLNSSATFNAALTADNLTIAASKTATVKAAVTVASNITLNNSSTLEVINTSAMTVAGTIRENGGSATSTLITVKFNTADTAPSKVTFSGTVTADTIQVGDAAAATYAGYAHFTGSGGVTVGEARVTSGDHANEYSTLQFDYAVTASDQIIINDKNSTAYQAYLIFSGNNTATIAADINVSSHADDEGTLQVTGTGKTFTGNIGTSSAQLELINIDAATTFQGNVYTTDLEVDGGITSTGSIYVDELSTIGANVTTTGTQTYTGAVTLSGGDRTLQGSTINFGDTITGTGSHDLTITGALDLDGAMTSVVELSVSSTSNLGANVTTTGTQTYTGAVTLSDDITLTTSGADVIFNDEVITDYSSSTSVTEVIQFLGNGGYQYSSDGGSTYSSGTASSSETTLGSGYVTFVTDTYTWNFSQSSTIETLLVGGGGSGGPDLGGGGGGGGVISIPSLSISANTDYEIVVGDGGVSDGNTGGQGEDTTAFGATAAGGGTSGRHNNGAGTDGGSGGGAASNNSNINTGGSGQVGSSLGGHTGTIYGNDGGDNATQRVGDPTRGAGGGGAGAAAADSATSSTSDDGHVKA